MVNTDYLIHTLKNGIRIIHKQTDSPVGHLGVLINAGSRDEKDDEHGLAHFIEHSVFKGTKKRRAYHVLSRIEGVGGELNAYTTKEETVLYATFLTEYYERTAELLTDILFNSTYPEKEINREKEVVAEEINSYQDTPSELIFDEFEELVFDGHPIARNILGTKEKVRAFNRDKIFSFIEANYHTDQMVISSVGNIAFSALIKMLEKHFGEVEQKLRQATREKFLYYQPQIKTLQKDTFQAHCVMGNTAFDFKNPKRIAMVLLNNVLGGNALNSRLNLALRERRGMAYNVESGYSAYSDTGLFNVYFGTDKENLNKAVSLVYKEFELLRSTKMGAVQLSRAKKQLIGQIAVSTESREDLMLTIGKSFLLFDKVDPLREVFKKIDAISAEEVLEVANIVLDKNQMSTLIYK
ncbi:MAG TPA: pitrilysin family protein [Draconibacterium sp.]|nr:pitrilysin family protein [Draconibacterium sp.]